MTKVSASRLAARYFELRGQACLLIAEYESAGVTVPKRIRLFAGIRSQHQPRKGPKPVVLPKIVEWFQSRNNEPATYKEISAALGIKLGQVRTCVSRNEVEAFERVGGQEENGKLLAHVRLSSAGLNYAPRK